MQGGVGAYTEILAQHLQQRGLDIYLFSTSGTHSDTLPLTNTLSKWNFASLSTIRAWANDHQLDVINLQFQTAAFDMSPSIHFLPDFIRDLPVITTFHDLRFPYLFPKAGPLRDWIVMHLARRSAGVIVTNHEDQARLQHLPHQTLIPIGSNMLSSPAKDINIRAKIGAADDDFVLAYFGLINRSKGLETLLESLSRLNQERIPARLVIIGGVAGSSDSTNAAYQMHIEHHINRLNLSDIIYHTDFIEDDAEVGAYLQASDAVVLPFVDGASFRRGSLMAAIHYACPIITTMPRVPVPEFKHGENMLLVPPDDTEALTNTLRQLYISPEIRQYLREGAVQLATHFDWGQIAQDYLHFFENIVGDYT
jgi:glycosyltransferase involved in cell wall biosynthesis